MNPADVVFSGGLWISMPIAMIAGAVAFASPCVLPIVPGFLGLLTSLAGEDSSRRRALISVLLFIAGFAAIFVLGSVVVGAAAEALLRYRTLLVRVSGGLLVVFGLVFVGLFSGAQRSWKPKQIQTGGLWAAPVVGAVFAIGWTPCIGPTMAAITALGIDSGSAGKAALLGAAYALGLGLPFMAIALGLSWATRVTSWIRENMRCINLAGGLLIVTLGILMLLGLWSEATNLLQGWAADIAPVF